MRFEVLILGSNSALPANNRYPTAQILNIREQWMLIDCGEGTQSRMNRYNARRGKINFIFISHLHGDHIFGLPGLLTSYSLNGRDKPLHIYAPEGLEELLRLCLRTSGSVLSYELIFHTVDTENTTCILDTPIFSVTAFPLRHRIPTAGYLFQEKKRLSNIISEKIKEYDIPFDQIGAIKAGSDFTHTDGHIIPHQELLIPPPPPRSYAYCSDTMYEESIIPIIKGANLLYHETTFMHDKLERAIFSMHSTAHQAAVIAKKAAVQRLITGHYSSRYIDLEPLLQEARAVFPNTELGLEGKIYSIPPDGFIDL